MQLSRTKLQKSFMLSTKKWIKCLPEKNQVDSREKSGDITSNGMAIWVQASTWQQAAQWHGYSGASESESVCLSVKVSQSNLLLRQAVRSLTSPSWVQVLTLAKLHVRVLTSFIKLIKLFQNLMKLLPNHIMV